MLLRFSRRMSVNEPIVGSKLSWRQSLRRSLVNPLRSLRPATTDDELTVFIAQICPYAQRARIAIHELALPHTYVDIDLQNKPEYYTKDINQDGKVPAIRHGGVTFAESLVCLEYLSELAGHRLYPGNALQRAQIRHFIAFGDAKYCSKFYSILSAKDTESRETAIQDYLVILKRLSQWLAASNKDGPYFLGDQFTAADAALAPWAARMFLLEHYRGFVLPENNDDLKRYLQWHQAVLQHPSVKETTADHDFLIKSYERYAN